MWPISGIKNIIIAAIVAAVVGVFGYTVVSLKNEISAAREAAYIAGQIAERGEWQAKAKAAAEAAEKARKEAQERINRIEADYLKKQAQIQRQYEDQLADLESALNQEHADEASNGGDKANGACPPRGISQRLSDKLNAIGR